jgi:hypothetical protein
MADYDYNRNVEPEKVTAFAECHRIEGVHAVSVRTDSSTQTDRECEKQLLLIANINIFLMLFHC